MPLTLTVQSNVTGFVTITGQQQGHQRPHTADDKQDQKENTILQLSSITVARKTDGREAFYSESPLREISVTAQNEEIDVTPKNLPESESSQKSRAANYYCNDTNSNSNSITNNNNNKIYNKATDTAIYSEYKKNLAETDYKFQAYSSNAITLTTSPIIARTVQQAEQ